MNLPAPEILQRLIALHSDLGQSNGADCLDTLFEVLAENGFSWSDWPELFALCAKSSSQPKGLRRWVRGVHELIGRASTPGERRRARDKLIRRLGVESLSWTNDLPGILASEWRDSNPGAANPASAPTSVPDENIEDPNVFDVMVKVTEDRVVARRTEIVVAVLWDLFTYVRFAFPFAPNFGVTASASTRGKSTFRKVLQAMACNAWHAHRVSAAGFRRKLARKLEREEQTTAMLDEAENQNNFLREDEIRAIIDACFEPDGVITIAGKDGEPVDYPAQATVLYAVRGSLDVPLSIRSRGFQVVMKKGKPRMRLPRKYLEDPDLVGARTLAESWAARVQQLNLDPEMPPELCRDPRLEDICRPLVSIAESLGVSAEARAALIDVCATYPVSDVGVQALEDIKKVWETRSEHIFTLSNWTPQRLGLSRKEPELPAFDRIAKKAMVAGMIEVNPFWDSWRGPNDKGQPHSLTPGELSALLLRFGISIKSIWPLRRLPRDKSVPGYRYSQFVAAWQECCAENDTPTQARKIIQLPRHKRPTQNPRAPRG
jgi:hypothetical protein